MSTSKYPLRPLGEVLELDRQEVAVDPTHTYRTAGIYNRGRGLFERAPIVGAETSYANYYRLSEGQVVFSRLFAFEGSIAVVGPANDGLFVSNEFPTFSVKAGEAEISYLEGLVRWPTLHDLLADAATGMGQRRQRVHPDAFLEIKVPLPDLDEQRRVAGRLAALTARLDELCQRRVRSSSVAQQSARALLSEPVTSLSNEATWKRMALARGLAQSETRELVIPGTTYNIAGVYSFGRGLFARGPIDGSETTYKHLHRLRSGDLVLSRLKGWEGALAVIPEQFDGWFLSPEFPTFTIDDSIFDRRFLKHLVTSEILWSRLKVGSTGIGARKERVSAQRLLDLEVSVPTVTEQRRLADQLDLIEQVGRRGQSVDELVRALTPAILNRAFAGML